MVKFFNTENELNTYFPDELPLVIYYCNSKEDLIEKTIKCNEWPEQYTYYKNKLILLKMALESDQNLNHVLVKIFQDLSSFQLKTQVKKKL